MSSHVRPSSLHARKFAVEMIRNQSAGAQAWERASTNIDAVAYSTPRRARSCCHISCTSYHDHHLTCHSMLLTVASTERQQIIDSIHHHSLEKIQARTKSSKNISPNRRRRTSMLSDLLVHGLQLGPLIQTPVASLRLQPSIQRYPRRVRFVRPCKLISRQSDRSKLLHGAGCDRASAHRWGGYAGTNLHLCRHRRQRCVWLEIGGRESDGHRGRNLVKKKRVKNRYKSLCSREREEEAPVRPDRTSAPGARAGRRRARSHRAALRITCQQRISCSCPHRKDSTTSPCCRAALPMVAAGAPACRRRPPHGPQTAAPTAGGSC